MAEVHAGDHPDRLIDPDREMVAAALGHEPRDCPDCGSAHFGRVPCGLTFAERIRTVRVDPGVLETRNRRNYFDREAVEATFGEGAREQHLDATDGYGATRRDSDGRTWHQDRHSGTWEPMTDDEVDRVFLGADTEVDYADSELAELP